MSGSPVGDDVFGEDPSVNYLQDAFSELLGKEYGLFFPSGTMANQVSLQTLTRPGDTVIASKGAHILRYESGSAAGLAGLHIETIGKKIPFNAEELKKAIPPEDPHRSPVSLVALENTHNYGGGKILELEAIRKISHLTKQMGISLHLDGARLWNASIATGIPLSDWAEPFDTVSCCLSKGLGAPVGSLVATSKEIGPTLHRFRKRMGGGMRQAGILASAGLYAMTNQFERLAEDHDNARTLAKTLAAKGFEVEGEPDTNIVMFRCRGGSKFLQAAKKLGVLLIAFDEFRFRAVTHLHISPSDLERAAVILEEARENSEPTEPTRPAP